MKRTKIIYAIPLEAHNACGIDTGKICWGSCGKGNIGAVVLGEYGSGIPCSTPKDECPNLDKEMPSPFGTIQFGDHAEEYDVVLRKLKVTP